MRKWTMVMEPSLDDLLEDEIMMLVMRSAGVDAAELRARLAETARGLDLQRRHAQPARNPVAA